MKIRFYSKINYYKSQRFCQVWVFRRERCYKKLMLYVLWNFEVIFHFEKLPDDHTIITKLYFEQFVHMELEERHPAIVNLLNIFYNKTTQNLIIKNICYLKFRG